MSAENRGKLYVCCYTFSDNFSTHVPGCVKLVCQAVSACDTTELELNHNKITASWTQTWTHLFLFWPVCLHLRHTRFLTQTYSMHKYWEVAPHDVSWRFFHYLGFPQTASVRRQEAYTRLYCLLGFVCCFVFMFYDLKRYPIMDEADDEPLWWLWPCTDLSSTWSCTTTCDGIVTVTLKKHYSCKYGASGIPVAFVWCAASVLVHFYCIIKIQNGTGHSSNFSSQPVLHFSASISCHHTEAMQPYSETEPELGSEPKLKNRISLLLFFLAGLVPKLTIIATAFLELIWNCIRKLYR